MEKIAARTLLAGLTPETLAKDRAELEEIFGKSFFPNVFETEIGRAHV